MATLQQRLLSRLIIDPGTGCLLWTGSSNGRGYGQIWVDGTKQLVHRMMWTLFEGPIPDGLVIDHLCRVRRCANVTHLEPVTNRINLLRGTGFTALRAAVTECPQGHPYDELNTGRKKNGCRICRACHREQCRRYRRTVAS